MGVEEVLAEGKVCPDKPLELKNKVTSMTIGCLSGDFSNEKAVESAIILEGFNECFKLCRSEKCYHGFSCDYKKLGELPNSNDYTVNRIHSCDGGGPQRLVVTFGSTYDDAKCICSCPLKVELISFEAKKVTEGVSVQWETATECDVDKFILWKAKPLDGSCTDEQDNYLSPISLLQVPARGGMSWGSRYPYENDLLYVDINGNDEFCYGLQEIRSDGKWNLHVVKVE